MTEVQPYQVVRQLGEAELRLYPAHSLVSTQREGSLSNAGMSAFSSLIGYIQGRNQNRQQIAMTAPVLQHPTAKGYRVSFVMPADMSAPPAPVESGVTVVADQGGLVAAVQFTGLANESNFKRQGAKLLSLLSAHGLQPTGEVFYARYDGPWTAPFLRRNEALVSVVESAPTP